MINAQQDVELLNRPHHVTAIINFHQQRQFLVECLRLILKCSVDLEFDDEIRDVLRQLVSLILETKDGPTQNSSPYAQKCLRDMGDIEKWLHNLGERHQGDLTLGKPPSPEYDEIMNFQQFSLTQQHESLAAVLTYLIKANHTMTEDFSSFLDSLVDLDRWNSLAMHYVPVIIAFTSQYGSPEGNASFSEARSLDKKIMDSRDARPWNLRNLQAATVSWWLSEYSGWYLEQPPGSPTQRIDLGAEATARSDAFFRALRDGAFHCTLSLCSHLRPDDWNDQIRNGLTEHLLRDTPAIMHGAATTSNYFQDLVMEQFETFIDAFITNMPDTLRKLRFEEDDQRKRINSGLQPRVQSGPLEQDMHLERFLVIISYAFENRVEAAQSFWADIDSNLYGFLQWASKRQSTPRVGAFCESLRSISKGEGCATSAHRFLLEEGNTTSVRIRRSSSLCWAQVIAELSLYASKITEHSANVRQINQFSGRPNLDDIDEPESALMLECYLRLTAHICRESTVARSWFLDHPTFFMPEVLFLLCSNTVPSRIHACAFATLRALLVEKSAEFGMVIWNTLDLWASGGFTPSTTGQRPAKTSHSSAWIEEVTFEAIGNDIEVTSEFVGLLNSLVSPAADESGLNDSLPFLEQLGSTYRISGIDPYIDFVLGRIFAVHVHHLENSLQLKILRLNVLDFIATCLGTFNEDLVILANRSTMPVDTAMNTSSLRSYIRLHPFSRVMEWMFNERVLAVLFSAAHQDIEEVSKASPNGPLILGLLRSIDVMNLIMDLQSTYLDIVRPLMKVSGISGQRVYNPSLGSFEDSVAINLNLVVDLGMYCSIGIQQLTVSSLGLLEKLASSRKLNVQSVPGMNKRLNSNRLIGVLEQNNDLERVAHSLVLAMEFDSRELDYGPSAPGWTIKSAILDFLNHCLAVSPNKPALPHALLGFLCTGSTLDVETDGLFARGSSLFHAILRLTVEYPDEIEGVMPFWSLSLRQKGLQVLSTLWSSPLTSVFTLAELRAGDFLFALFLKQKMVEPSTIWDGQSIKDTDFMCSESALAYDQYLRQRCHLYNYASTEISLVAAEIIPSLKARILSTLLGSTTLPNGDEFSNATIFDLVDFIELEFYDSNVMPASVYFDDVDFHSSIGLDVGDTSIGYNIKIIQEMISLHLNAMRKTGRLQDQNDEQQASFDAQNILLHFHGRNNYRRLSSARLQTIKAWVNLLTLVVNQCDLDQANKTSLILQIFQIIVPKLEKYAMDSAAEAVDLATLVQALLLEFDFKLSASGVVSGGDIANDRLFQIFRTALRSIHVPDGDAQLREILYNICHRYLTGIADAPNASSRHRHNMQTVKMAGEKLIDVICDDAYGGSGACRISALLLLDSLAVTARIEKSNYLIDSLMRTNFTLVLVETIKDIPQELHDTDRKGR